MTDRNILVAIDGSKNSMRALFAAKKQAHQGNKELTILTVLPPLFLPYFGNSEMSKQDRENIRKSREELLETALEKIKVFEGTVHTKMREGDPAEEILAEIEEGDYSLVVLGSKGLGLFTRTLLGSVSNKVLNHTKESVLIIK